MAFTSAIRIRGDMLYCPLPFYIDSYWTCEPNCHHCYARRLNRTWGTDFRKADPKAVKKRLLSNKGNSPLSFAIKQRKTVRLGNRTDPFQKCEETHLVSSEILSFLLEQKWETVVQTKFPQRAWNLVKLDEFSIILAEITVGLEADWELLEKGMTENPIDRIRTLSRMKKKGIPIGVNGEPFIPGYHTPEQFRETMKLLKAHGINRFNTYNLHFNDLVAKNFHEIGIDIEKVWEMNQDGPWRKLLRKLLNIAEQYGIILGCPDFVNSGWKWKERANTCCGIDVKNPCTFNTHFFKKAIQEGTDPLACWDNVGVFEEGVKIVEGTTDKMYTLKDVK